MHNKILNITNGEYFNEVKASDFGLFEENEDKNLFSQHKI